MRHEYVSKKSMGFCQGGKLSTSSGGGVGSTITLRRGFGAGCAAALSAILEAAAAAAQPRHIERMLPSQLPACSLSIQLYIVQDQDRANSAFVTGLNIRMSGISYCATFFSRVLHIERGHPRLS